MGFLKVVLCFLLFVLVLLFLCVFWHCRVLGFAIFVVLRMLRVQGMSSFEGDRLGKQVRQMQRWVEEGPDIVKKGAGSFGFAGIGTILISQFLLFGTVYFLLDGDYIPAAVAGWLCYVALRGLLKRLVAIEANATQA